ncbi:Zn-ribbon domain-containing OB-fold protein [Chloroflexota bacterium]
MKTEKDYVAIKDEFFSKPLYPLEKVTLMGSRCRNCEEVYFGKAVACQNCQGEDLEDTALSREGTLYTYTIIQNKPPGDYKGSDPFEPFAVGLVELPEGIRILAPLAGCSFDEIKIGMKLKLSIDEFYKDEEGRTVLSYSFRPHR